MSYFVEYCRNTCNERRRLFQERNAALAELRSLMDERQWVSADERLPEVSGYYLTFRPGVHPEDRMVSLFFFADEPAWEGVFSSPEHRVTHWMPMPRQPIME